MINATLKKFGYPDSLIKEYAHWYLLLRPKQVTVGSLILLCKDEVTRFSGITSGSFQEYSRIIQEIEHTLAGLFHYDKINYLMLMMVDPDVHYHIIPRYAKPVQVLGQEFKDHDWPGAPTLKTVNNLSAEEFRKLRDLLKSKVPAGKTYQRVYTTGCFDLFHMGHLNILKKSKEIGEHLLVGVSTDELMAKEKGSRPMVPFEERVAIVKSIAYVDEVIPQADKDKQKIVDQYNIDAITVGDDWRGKYPPVSCEVVYFPYTEHVSTSKILTEIKSREERK